MEIYLKVYTSYNKKGEVLPSTEKTIFKKSNYHNLSFNTETGAVKSMGIQRKSMTEKLSEYFYLIDKKTKGKVVEQLREMAEMRRKSFKDAYKAYQSNFKRI